MANNVTVNRSRSQAPRSRVKKRLQLCAGLLLCVVAFLVLNIKLQAARAPLSTEGIQADIDAASPGDVIWIPSNTYEGQLVIDKDLTLMGSGSSTVIVAPETLLSASFSTSVGNTYYPVVYVHDAANVTIQDLVVDGKGLGNLYTDVGASFVGIAFYNAGGRVTGVEVTGIHDTPWTATSHRALYAYADGGASQDLYVAYSDFHDFQKNGVVFWGDGLTAQASRNSIVGRGPTGLVAQNGVVVGPGVAGIVGPSNNITDFSYTAGGIAASGILIYSSDARVYNNVVANSQIGVYLWEGGGDIRGNHVTVGDSAAEPWGIVGTVGGTARAADGGVLLASTEDDVGVRDPTAGLTITIAENSLIGDGVNVDSTGIEAYVGSDAGDVALYIADNTIRDWGEGAVLYRGATSRAVNGSSFVLRGNWIEGNLSYGVSATGFLTSGVDAQANWWGHNTGPRDESNDSGGFYNPDGQGDAVSDGVNYLHWLRRTYLPLVIRD